MGFRQFDTSEGFYGDTKDCLSDAILDSRVPRAEFLLMGRLENDQFANVDE